MTCVDLIDPLRERRPCEAGDANTLRPVIEAAVAAAFGVSARQMRASSRCAQPVAFARQSAMYLAHVVFGLSYAKTGALFRRDRTTAAYACRLVEDRRDNPAIDHLLQVLEAVCGEIARGRRTSVS